MRAFITGSRAYGIPHAESDIDLVIRCEPSVITALVAAGADPSVKDTTDPEYLRHMGSVSLRFGSLNLLCCTTDAIYYAWALGTGKVMQMKPATREQAQEIMEGLRQIAYEVDPGAGA